jgi:hypothetical protein
VDVAADGKLYFADSSIHFGARQWGGTYPAGVLDVLQHGATAGFLFTNCGIYVRSLVMDALGRRQKNQSRAVSSSPEIVYFRVAPGGTQGGAAPTCICV